MCRVSSTRRCEWPLTGGRDDGRWGRPGLDWRSCGVVHPPRPHTPTPHLSRSARPSLAQPLPSWASNVCLARRRHAQVGCSTAPPSFAPRSHRWWGTRSPAVEGRVKEATHYCDAAVVASVVSIPSFSAASLALTMQSNPYTTSVRPALSTAHPHLQSSSFLIPPLSYPPSCSTTTAAPSRSGEGAKRDNERGAPSAGDPRRIGAVGLSSSPCPSLPSFSFSPSASPSGLGRISSPPRSCSRRPIIERRLIRPSAQLSRSPPPVH